ncbi:MULTISPECIES: hypothetical protein [Serratia]|uniref:hypothetical protein n=1 Tax=Serratia TaxID=613 RepID=UPI0020A4AD84|nr:hypothetical protein [Serratia marcescens]
MKYFINHILGRYYLHGTGHFAFYQANRLHTAINSIPESDNQNRYRHYPYLCGRLQRRVLRGRCRAHYRQRGSNVGTRTRRDGKWQPGATARRRRQMPESKYIGMRVKTDYTINSSTMMMSAKSMFPSPNDKQPMEMATDLTALSLADYNYQPACSPVRIK